MPPSAYDHAPTPPRPKTHYLPDGPAPARDAEEVAILRGHVPAFVADGPFVAWVRHPDPVRGQWTKLPLDPLVPGRSARCGDPRSWGSLEEAVACRRRFGLDGVARVLVEGERVVGGDVDHVEAPGPGLAPHGAYTEISPGGQGVRFFLEGAFPESGRLGRKHGDVELYAGRRFLTVTARTLQSGGEVDPDALGVWYREQFPPPPVPPAAPAATRWSPPQSDHELLERARSARNGHLFSRLWDGDLSLHGGDHSRADASLVARLLWWCGGDAGRADRLFRQSGLMRSKWDRRSYGDGRSYGQGLLDHMGGAR